MRKKALITGIAGQDGSYLTEHLLSLGYEVHGIVRRHSVAENQNHRLHKLNLTNNVFTYYGDLLDYPSLVRIISDVKPDEIYNLGAMSHVRVSFDMPSFTIQTNALGVLHMLEVYRTICPEAKFYQASSSEMFGNSVDDDGVQRLTTPMNPVSPYGCAKVMGFNLVRHYRHATSTWL
jgi:GDPmannose 4,6-dehydratase